MNRIIKLAFNSLCPSFRSRYDSARIADDSEYENLRPISIKKMNLMPHIRRELNKRRQAPLRAVRARGKKLTVIVPFRDRWEHLGVFEKEAIPYIMGQCHDCEVLVVEQEFGKPFNKGMLMNIGVKEARPDSEYFCLHDVDFIPISADYSYCSHPVRIVSEVVSDSAETMYSGREMFMHQYFGGVVLMSREHYTAINGASNDYWHFLYEDDDMFLRLLYRGFTPLREMTGRFRELYHAPSLFNDEWGRRIENSEERKKLRAKRRMNSRIYRRFRRKLIGYESGLSSVQYKVLRREERDVYKIITVSI